MKTTAAAAAAALILASAARAETPGGWSVETPKDAPARLAFSAPGLPPVAFACERKSGLVAVRFPLQRRYAERQAAGVWVDDAGLAGPWPVSIAYEAGADRTVLRGRVEPDQADGASTAVGEIATAAPVLKSFGKTGALTFRAAGETVSPPPAKPGMVRKFLGACR